MMRVFSANPTIPVLAACGICGTQITVERHRDEAGHLWVSGEELVRSWLEHQILDCVPSADEEMEV